MLPFDKGKRQPTVVGPSSDLVSSALNSAMSKFINAVQAGNVPDALEAYKTLCALGDMDD